MSIRLCPLLSIKSKNHHTAATSLVSTSFYFSTAALTAVTTSLFPWKTISFHHGAAPIVLNHYLKTKPHLLCIHYGRKWPQVTSTPIKQNDPNTPKCFSCQPQLVFTGHSDWKQQSFKRKYKVLRVVSGTEDPENSDTSRDTPCYINRAAQIKSMRRPTMQTLVWTHIFSLIFTQSGRQTSCVGPECDLRKRWTSLNPGTAGMTCNTSMKNSASQSFLDLLWRAPPRRPVGWQSGLLRF